ncbi:amino acid permease C-terminal domain-containing protein [Streptomyces sp. NPDC002055]|uniref:amino acid permease C-terminal domain-containing protein n=1 Tax=Streptomyces sp. NPDC002055 TaxID=3154534 RepID=UPI0033329B6F
MRSPEGMSGCVGFLLEVVGVQLPVWAMGAPGTGDGHRIDLVAVLICLGVAWLLTRGTRTSARVETVLTIVKIAIVLVVVAFVVVSAAVLILRYRKPNLSRGFRCPGMPFTPVLGIAFSVWLMSFLRMETWLRLGAWLVVGLVVYAAYGYRRTRRVMPGGSVDLDALEEMSDSDEPAPAAAAPPQETTGTR